MKTVSLRKTRDFWNTVFQAILAEIRLKNPVFLQKAGIFWEKNYLFSFFTLISLEDPWGVCCWNMDLWEWLETNQPITQRPAFGGKSLMCNGILISLEKYWNEIWLAIWKPYQVWNAWFVLPCYTNLEGIYDFWRMENIVKPKLPLLVSQLKIG